MPVTPIAGHRDRFLPTYTVHLSQHYQLIAESKVSCPPTHSSWACPPSAHSFSWACPPSAHSFFMGMPSICPHRRRPPLMRILLPLPLLLGWQARCRHPSRKCVQGRRRGRRRHDKGVLVGGEQRTHKARRLERPPARHARVHILEEVVDVT